MKDKLNKIFITMVMIFLTIDIIVIELIFLIGICFSFKDYLLLVL